MPDENTKLNNVKFSEQTCLDYLINELEFALAFEAVHGTRETHFLLYWM